MAANNIINSLGLTPLSIEDKTITTAPQVNSNDAEADADVQTAREGLYKALDYSRGVVEDMVSIAQQSQHPKAYEILNSAIKTLADISSELGTLQLKKQRLIQNKKGDDQEAGVVNNNLFVGSTSDLQDLLEQMAAKQLEKQNVKPTDE